MKTKEQIIYLGSNILSTIIVIYNFIILTHVKLTSDFPEKLKACFSCFSFIKSSSSWDFCLLILKFYALLFFDLAKFYMLLSEQSDNTGKPTKDFMSSEFGGKSNCQGRWTLSHTKFLVLPSDSSSFQCPHGIYESFAHPEWKKNKTNTGSYFASQFQKIGFFQCNTIDRVNFRRLNFPNATQLIKILLNLTLREIRYAVKNTLDYLFR